LPWTSKSGYEHLPAQSRAIAINAISFFIKSYCSATHNAVPGRMNVTLPNVLLSVLVLYVHFCVVLTFFKEYACQYNLL
jgi:hypothetical protein